MFMGRLPVLTFTARNVHTAKLFSFEVLSFFFVTTGDNLQPKTLLQQQLGLFGSLRGVG